jgi:hypothetical protein
MLPTKSSFYLLSGVQPYDPDILIRIRENIMVVSQTLEQIEEPINANTLHNTLASALGSVTGTIIGGGRHTVLVQQFPVSESKSLVLKIFRLSLEEIMLHCLTLQEFNNQFQNSPFGTKFGSLQVKVMDVYAVGSIAIGAIRFPFLIQEFSPGLPFQEIVTKEGRRPPFPQILGSVFQTIAKKGYFLDPFPTNWLVISTADNPDCVYTLHYLDLIFLKDPSAIKAANTFGFYFQT